MQQHRGTWWGKNVWQKPSVFSRLLCNHLVPRTVANQQLGEEEKEEVVKRCDIISSVCTTDVFDCHRNTSCWYSHTVLLTTVYLCLLLEEHHLPDGARFRARKSPDQTEDVLSLETSSFAFYVVFPSLLCFFFFCLPLKSKGLRVIGKERPSGFQADGEKPQEMFLNTVSVSLSNKLRPTPPRSPLSQPSEKLSHRRPLVFLIFWSPAVSNSCSLVPLFLAFLLNATCGGVSISGGERQKGLTVRFFSVRRPAVFLTRGVCVSDREALTQAAHSRTGWDSLFHWPNRKLRSES